MRMNLIQVCGSCSIWGIPWDIPLKRTAISPFRMDAVAIGMHLIAKAAERRGACGKRACGNHPTGTSAQQPSYFHFLYGGEIAAGVLKDKKRRGGEISFVLPTKIGHCEIVKIPTEEVLDLVRTALA